MTAERYAVKYPDGRDHVAQTPAEAVELVKAAGSQIVTVIPFRLVTS